MVGVDIAGTASHSSRDGVRTMPRNRATLGITLGASPVCSAPKTSRVAPNGADNSRIGPAAR